ncbi:hypothetical protein BD414DRAFT_483654 [Trametes punicea]|nr:hypothetical protein BD414DRAFT_483654 [Trametes punicea]
MPLLGETVQSSREKRLERQQARLRDRGGWVPAPPLTALLCYDSHRLAHVRIFKPSEHNPLLDILLARGVNGESPSRVNSPRRSRSRSASPSRKGQSVPSPKHKSRTTHSKSDRRISTVERIPQKSAKLDNSHIQGLSEDLIPSSSKCTKI